MASKATRGAYALKGIASLLQGYTRAKERERDLEELAADRELRRRQVEIAEAESERKRRPSGIYREDTSQFIDVPDKYSGVDVIRQQPSYNIVSPTGEMISALPPGQRATVLPKPSAPEETPAQKAAKALLQNIMEQQSKYGTLDPATAKSAEELGRVLGIPVTSSAVQENPNWFARRMFGAKAGPSSTQATIRIGSPVETPNPSGERGGVLPPPQAKEITPEIAAQILEEARGDKNKAREIARKRGYKF